MFRPKPKNIVSKVIDLTTGMQARDASHTWMSGDKTRVAKFGSTSRETFAQRRQADRQRQTIARYSDSQIASVSTTVRGDITRAANLEREKIQNRFSDQNETAPDNITNPTPPQPVAPPATSNPLFYPDFRSKS